MGRRLIEKDQEAMRILSVSRGKTLSNSVCATFQKDTGKKQPEMYVEGWGKCTVGKHFVKYGPPAKTSSPPFWRTKTRVVRRQAQNGSCALLTDVV